MHKKTLLGDDHNDVFISLIFLDKQGQSTVNMGLINKVDMVCLSPVGYGV